MFTVRSSDNEIIEVTWPLNYSPTSTSNRHRSIGETDWESICEPTAVIDASGICGTRNSVGTTVSSVQDNGGIWL